MYQKCPKCGHERQATETGDPGICPACGLVFAKWVQRVAGVPARAPRLEQEVERVPGFFARQLALALQVPERVNPMEFWGRVGFYVILFAWGWYFILLDFRTNEIGESFMHRVNLAFHEAGHVAFIPFGRFLHIAGGSLGQLIMPAIVLGVFLWKQHDGFGASAGLWWFGQSLMDLAPYINDARDLVLPLVGGGTGMDRPDTHDWRNILSDLHLLNRDHQIAWCADFMGEVIVIIALAWGGYQLYRQYRNLSMKMGD
jgi:hypothetical protein